MKTHENKARRTLSARLAASLRRNRDGAPTAATAGQAQDVCEALKAKPEGQTEARLKIQRSGAFTTAPQAGAEAI